MGKLEKFLWCMELRTGALIWGFTAIFLHISLMLILLAGWYLTRNKETEEDASAGIGLFMLLLISLGVFVRFVQGIFKNNTNLVALGVFYNFLLLVFALYLTVSSAYYGNFTSVLYQLTITVWLYYVQCVCFAYFKKMQEENTKDQNVEYHADATSEQPLTQTQPQIQPQPQPMKPQPQLQSQPEPQQKSPV